MPACIAFLIDINDHNAFSQYARAAGPTITAHGGRIPFRGPVVEVLEGGLDVGDDTRLVLVEFPTVEKARAWWESAAYQALVGLRVTPVSSSRVFLVDGIDLGEQPLIRPAPTTTQPERTP
jgi:uncharacterized protein (DUF1330 family)